MKNIKKKGKKIKYEPNLTTIMINTKKFLGIPLDKNTPVTKTRRISEEGCFISR